MLGSVHFSIVNLGRDAQFGQLSLVGGRTRRRLPFRKRSQLSLPIISHDLATVCWEVLRPVIHFLVSTCCRNAFALLLKDCDPVSFLSSETLVVGSLHLSIELGVIMRHVVSFDT